MAAVEERIHRAIDEIAGNEALLEMLETEAAVEMLEWGNAMVVSLVSKTEDMDDLTAEEVLEPQLKAVRQVMRSAGNWAAGKYIDPESRIQLRDKLLGNFRTILGDDARLPSTEEMDALLGQVDEPGNTPHQLILKLRDLVYGSV